MMKHSLLLKFKQQKIKSNQTHLKVHKNKGEEKKHKNKYVDKSNLDEVKKEIKKAKEKLKEILNHNHIPDSTYSKTTVLLMKHLLAEIEKLEKLIEKIDNANSLKNTFTKRTVNFSLILHLRNFNVLKKGIRLSEIKTLIENINKAVKDLKKLNPKAESIKNTSTLIRPTESDKHKQHSPSQPTDELKNQSKPQKISIKQNDESEIEKKTGEKKQRLYESKKEMKNKTIYLIKKETHSLKTEDAKSQTSPSPTKQKTLQSIRENIVKLSSAVKTSITEKKKMMLVKLNPPELGEVKISILKENGEIKVKVIFNNDKAFNMFLDKADTIKSSIESQGINLSSLEMGMDFKSFSGNGNSSESWEKQPIFYDTFSNLLEDNSKTNEEITFAETGKTHKLNLLA